MIQKNPLLKPSEWRGKVAPENKIEKKQEIINESNIGFRQYRLRYIDLILKIVMFENNDVSRKIESLKKCQRICSYQECNKVFNSFRRKCNVCGDKVVAKENKETRLTTPKDWVLEKALSIGQKIKKYIKPIKIGEPLMVNPNSFINVEHILSEYKKLHGIGVVRE